MTAVSVFMSFGVVRLLDGLRASLRSGSRYWVHSVWVLLRLFSYVLLWWGSWAVHDMEVWNLLRFSLYLIPLGLVYLQATALVTTHPAEVRDWKAHYYEIRLWFFAVNIAYIVTLYLSTIVFGAVAATLAFTIPFLITLVISIVGCISVSHKVHATIIVIQVANVILGFGVQLFDPTTIILDSSNP
jgi:hypothetical protein